MGPMAGVDRTRTAQDKHRDAAAAITGATTTEAVRLTVDF